MTWILLVSGFQQHMLDEIKNGHESWITHAIVVNCGVGAIYSPTPSALHYGENYNIFQKLFDHWFNEVMKLLLLT